VSDLTLLVIAKEPVPGNVKTRLARDIGDRAAAQVAEACLADTLAAVAATPARRRVLVLEGHPGPWLPAGIEVVPQSSGGLGDRLAAAFAGVDGPAFLVGMDTPQLTNEHLAVDFGATDAVLGLATDGGYWGIGMRAPRPEAFRSVPMSTRTTGAVQRRRLRQLGLTVGDLSSLTDVDTLTDARAVAADAPASRFAAVWGRLEQRRPGRTSSGTGGGPRVAGVPEALDLYDDAVRTGRRLRLVASDGKRLPFELERWTGPADVVDQGLLDRCTGATLDVGCGPGRLAAGLSRRGQQVLGVDVAASAVERTASLGARAVCRSVFDQLPREGRWDTVLLADGNVGIGGDPTRLLARTHALLSEGGRLVVEPEPVEVDEVVELALQAVDGTSALSASFRWARLGVAATMRRGRAAGFTVEESWTSGGRCFVVLHR